MIIFINHTLYVSYSLSSHMDWVLQASAFKLLTCSSWPRHAVLQNRKAWCYNLSLIPFVTT
jgi:hypothetical protein